MFSLAVYTGLVGNPPQQTAVGAAINRFEWPWVRQVIAHTFELEFKCVSVVTQRYNNC